MCIGDIKTFFKVSAGYSVVLESLTNRLMVKTGIAFLEHLNTFRVGTTAAGR